MNLPALSETVKLATCVFLSVSLLWLCLSGCVHLDVCAVAPVCVCVCVCVCVWSISWLKGSSMTTAPRATEVQATEDLITPTPIPAMHTHTHTHTHTDADTHTHLTLKRLSLSSPPLLTCSECYHCTKRVLSAVISSADRNHTAAIFLSCRAQVWEAWIHGWCCSVVFKAPDNLTQLPDWSATER